MRADLTGQRFGRLTVVRYAGDTWNKVSKWFCQCDCGGTKVAQINNLKSGDTQSCGCWQKQRIKETKTTHGASVNGHQTTEYGIWANMVQRCGNANRWDFKHYGGRGISVCERWKSFENFLADMGPRPPGLTLERVNNEGNYQPDNCKWATRSEQRRNTRKRHAPLQTIL